MLDGGAKFSSMDQALAKRLGMETTKEKMIVNTLESTIMKERQVCHANISSMDQVYVLENSRFTIAEALPTTTCAIPRNKNISEYAHLKGVEVIELPKQQRVSLIIGTNEPSAHVPSEVRRGSRFEPQALKTPFGWTVVSTGSANRQGAFLQKDRGNCTPLWSRQ